MMKFNIVTFGCQINEYESDRFREVFINLGFEEVGDNRDADFVLFNSCSVRGKSEAKLMSGVGFVRSLFKKQGHPRSIVTGCVATTEEKHIKRIGQESLLAVMRGDEPLEERQERLAGILNSISPESARMKFITKPSEFVPVIFGCNSFCTYCIVPITKGREKSRSIDKISSEGERLISQGTKEINLLGQNINHYGLDLGNKNGFIELLERVDRIEGLKRLRFLTSYPSDFSSEILVRMSKLEHLCPHFHLPVQSGSDRILSLMKRGYTVEFYMELINKIRGIFNDVSITTDIIVGFPGETEEDFMMTRKLVEEIRFDKAFIVAYSKRPYTLASRMDKQVEEDVKKQRLNDLLKIQNDISLEKNRSYIGKIVEILVEGSDKGSTFGRIPQDKLVIAEGISGEPGELVNVRITDADFIHLRGVRA
jgi:tRNA-2-methylthio-N6-dimethylallyladenosine synthase